MPSTLSFFSLWSHLSTFLNVLNFAKHIDLWRELFFLNIVIWVGFFLYNWKFEMTSFWSRSLNKKKLFLTSPSSHTRHYLSPSPFSSLPLHTLVVDRLADSWWCRESRDFELEPSSSSNSSECIFELESDSSGECDPPSFGQEVQTDKGGAWKELSRSWLRSSGAKGRHSWASGDTPCECRRRWNAVVWLHRGSCTAPGMEPLPKNRRAWRWHSPSRFIN